MHSRDRAVSPVIGAVLVVAITVTLAATVGALTLGFDSRLDAPAPYAAFEVTYDPAGTGNGGIAYLNVTHTGGNVGDGSEVYVVDDAGNRVAWTDVWTGGGTVDVGEHVHVDGKGSDCELNAPREGATYRVVYRGDGSEQVLAEYEVERPPANPGTYSC